MSLWLLVGLVTDVSKTVGSFLNLRRLANLQRVVQEPGVAVTVRDHVDLVRHDQVVELGSLGWSGIVYERVVLPGWFCDVVAVAAVQERVGDGLGVVVHVSSVSLDDACFAAERPCVISLCWVHGQHSDQRRSVADERIQFRNQSVVASWAGRGRSRASDILLSIGQSLVTRHHDVMVRAGAQIGHSLVKRNELETAVELHSAPEVRYGLVAEQDSVAGILLQEVA